MELLRLKDVRMTERDRVFRYSPARALVGAFAVICTSGGLVLLGWLGRAGWPLYVSATLVLLILLLMRRLVLARFRASNWLLRTSDAGLFVQFRSYLNYHFPREDPTVVFIPYHEIRSARLVRERREIPDTDSRSGQSTSVQFRRFVELELAGDSAPLARALRAESEKLAPKEARGYRSIYRHSPVRLISPTRLQLEWGVVPSARVLVNALRRYTEIAAPVRESQDYAHLKGLGREEQESRLLKLVESGQTMTAIKMARALYAYDLTKARAFVEGLQRGKAGGAPGDGR